MAIAKKGIGITLLIRAMGACVQPYMPPETIGNRNYLVVGGFLNGGGATIINLSRTRGLNDTIPNQPESGAQVTVLGSLGDITPLTNIGNGNYEIDNLNMNSGEQYQLQILTPDGKKYLSDTVSVLQTPPIDSLNWKQDTADAPSKLGVTIYVNTHDNSKPYGYYRWEFAETWLYTAAYESYAYYDNGLVARTPQQQIYKCWRDQLSTSLVVGTSLQLSQNLIYEQPVQFIPQGDQRLGVKYSILVKQYEISPDAYDYWYNLKKTTELTGSIFDPMPSQVQGNIHNVADAAEPVLGFLSASGAQESRIYISNRDLFRWGYVISGCQELVLTPDLFDQYFRAGGYVPTSPKGLVNYGATTPSCADCTLQGGSTTMPVWWQ